MYVHTIGTDGIKIGFSIIQLLQRKIQLKTIQENF